MKSFKHKVLSLFSLVCVSWAGGQTVSAPPGYAFITADLTKGEIKKWNEAGQSTWLYTQVKCIDAWALPDGTVLTAYLPSNQTAGRGGVRLINEAKETVFDYNFNDEIMSVQPLANGNFVIAECHRGLITEFNRAGERIHSFRVKSEPNGHKTIRQFRLTARGTYFVCECYNHKAREYDRDGTMLAEHDLKFCYCPQPQPNGNVIVACWNAPHAQVVELDPAGEVVWQLKAAELPAEMGVSRIAETIRLPNGNLLISASCQPEKQKRAKTMLFEMTPAKQIVWQMTDPDSSTRITAVKLIPAAPVE